MPPRAESLPASSASAGRLPVPSALSRTCRPSPLRGNCLLPFFFNNGSYFPREIGEGSPHIRLSRPWLAGAPVRILLVPTTRNVRRLLIGDSRIVSMGGAIPGCQGRGPPRHRAGGSPDAPTITSALCCNVLRRPDTWPIAHPDPHQSQRRAWHHHARVYISPPLATKLLDGLTGVELDFVGPGPLYLSADPRNYSRPNALPVLLLSGACEVALHPESPDT